MAALPHIDAPLTDGKVALRPSAERDIPEVLIAYQDDPQLHLRLGEERPPSGAQLGARQEVAGSAWARGLAVTLTVTGPAHDTCLGQVSIPRFDWGERQAGLVMWLAPGARGGGLGVAALRLASDWLLRAAGLRRIELSIPADNEPMLATARAAGFEVEAAGSNAVPGAGPGPGRGHPGVVLLARSAIGAGS